MIENQHQYRFTLSKIEELEQRLAELETPDPSLHPRQVIGRRNSFNLTLCQLKQEITEYDRQLLVRSTANIDRNF
jgi:HTH-type transcriptional regulator/antitoxin HipB